MGSKIIYEDWQKDFIYLAFFDFTLKDISNQIGIAYHNLKNLVKEIKLSKPLKVNIGDKFGKLIVVEQLENKKRQKIWRCQCKCGNFMEAATNTLTSGHSKTCGCGRLEAIDHGFEFVPGWYFGQLKRGAKNRNIEFNITIEDINNQLIKQNFKCSLSGLTIQFFKANIRENLTKTTASVDRIDNNKGYTKDNIQILHTDVNILKNVYPQNYFIKLCYLIGKNFNKELDCELGEDFLRWHEKGGCFKNVRREMRKIKNEKSDR